MISSNPKQLSPLLSVVIKLLFAWCYSVGYTQLFAAIADLPGLSWLQLVFLSLFMALLALLTWGKRNLLISGSVLVVLGLAALAFRSALVRSWQTALPDLIDFLTWANNWLWGVKVEHDSRPAQLIFLVGLGICLAAYLLIARFCRPVLPGLALVVLLVIAGNPLREGRFIWFLLCAVTSLAAVARKQRTGRQLAAKVRNRAQAGFMLQSLPVSIIGLLLTALLATQISPAIFYSSHLGKIVDDAANIITSSLGMQRRVTGFSIAEAGYYPLFDRLGGPVRLSTSPVMQIRGYPQSLLLRGNVAVTYDGQRWYPAEDEDVYVFASPLHLEEQVVAFNLDLPDPILVPDLEGVFQENITYKITPLESRMQTVFIAGRPMEISLEGEARNQFFYNSSGRVQSRFWLTEDDTVVVSARRILSRNRDFNRQVRRIQSFLEQEQIQAEMDLVSRWLQLPDREEYREEGELTRLVARITAGRSGDLEKAQAIRSFLFSHAQYNLTVAVPPPDVDFVSFFLDTREGYCVYFATAMTMMSRLAGIPARYVEGYYAPPGTGPDAARIITGEYAHAWTEIYLYGIGWIAMDATPGGIAAEPVIDDITPTPEPLPTVTPQIPTPAGGEGRVPTLTPPVTPERPDIDDTSSPAVLIWILLLAAAIIAYCAVSALLLRASHIHAKMKQKIKDSRSLALFYWKQVRLLMRYLGFSMRGNETVRDWLQRINHQSRWLAGREELLENMTSAVEKTYYSRREPGAAELLSLSAVYDILEATARQNSNPLKYLILRLLPAVWQHRANPDA